MNGLVILAVFVGIVFLIGNVVETRARRGLKSQPMEDLRIAYAPNLIQALQAQGNNAYLEEKRREQEPWDRYKREYEDARIKRWIEGNPVTDENPLTKKEQPILPHSSYSYFP